MKKILYIYNTKIIQSTIQYRLYYSIFLSIIIKFGLFKKIYIYKNESEEIYFSKKTINSERVVKNFGIFYHQSNFVNTETEVVLFCDRIDFGGDNGEYMYEYYAQNFPSKKIYYVISDGSTDTKRLLEKNFNLLIFNSKEFRKIYKKADIIYSSILDYKIENYRSLRYSFFRPPTNKFIFLPHGLTRGDHGLLFFRYKIYTIACATPSEKKIFIKTTPIPVEKLLLSGYPRTDMRYRQKKSTIVYAPTWDNSKISNTLDLKWLKDGKIRTFLAKENLELVILPHHKLQISDSDRIYFRIPTNIDYNFEISRCKYLITDYSSVYADFMWEAIPIHFLHNFEYHYNQSINYSELGVVSLSYNELIDNVVSNNKHLEINSEHLSYTDRKNREKIVRLLGEK